MQTPDSAVTNGAELLSLEQVIGTAISNSPTMTAARERVAAASAVLEHARAQFLPTLDLVQHYQVTNNPVQSFMFTLNQAQFDLRSDFNDPGTNDDWHTRLILQQELYTGGARTANAKSAAAREAARQRELLAVRNALTFQAARAFYRLLQAERLVEIHREAIERVKQHLETVTLRFEAGTAVKSDVLTIEVRLAEEEEALIAARTQLDIAWDVLENVAAVSFRGFVLPADAPALPWEPLDIELEAAVERALRERPALAAMESERESAEHMQRRAAAGYLPQASVVADYDVHSGDLSSQDESYFVGVSVRVPLLDGWRTRAAVREARAQRSQISAQLRQARLDIALDVRRAYRGVKDARARVAVAQQAIERAAESLREIEMRYENGAATITELVDGQVQLTTARGRHTVATADLRIARCRLLWAVGGLVTEVVSAVETP